MKPAWTVAFLFLVLLAAAACEEKQVAETVELPPAAEGWDGSKSLLCGDGDVVTVERVTATLPGDVAVIAKGSCVLTLVDCTIDAGIGIQAVGAAQVTMKGGTLKGSEAAIDARDTAQVSAFGVQVSGKRNASSTARVREKKAR